MRIYKEKGGEKLRHEVVGIVKSSESCVHTFPSFYTPVSAYLPWIHENLKKFGSQSRIEKISSFPSIVDLVKYEFLLVEIQNLFPHLISVDLPDEVSGWLRSGRKKNVCRYKT